MTLDLNGQAYTFAARVFHDDNIDTDTYTVFGFRRRNSDFEGFDVRTGDCGLQLVLDTDGGGVEVRDCGGNFENNSEWSHMAVVIDNERDQALSYIDGERVNKSSFSESGTISVTSTARIGDKTDGGWVFAGYIDDVRIYPYALNEEQVNQVMNSGAGSFG